MELEYLGGNCVVINTKKARLVVDDNLAKLGQKTVIKPDDIVLYSTAHDKTLTTPKLIIDTPGDYEVSDISIHGIGSRSHNEETGQKSSVIYKVVVNDIRIALVGNIYPDLNDAQLEGIGTVDILVLPVGGNSYTLNGQEALKIIKKIEPKIVVPTHYADKQLKYEVEQQSLEDAIKELALEAKPVLDSLKIKASDLSETTELVILKRQ